MLPLCLSFVISYYIVTKHDLVHWTKKNSGYGTESNRILNLLTKTEHFLVVTKVAFSQVAWL